MYLNNGVLGQRLGHVVGKALTYKRGFGDVTTCGYLVKAHLPWHHSTQLGEALLQEQRPIGTLWMGCHTCVLKKSRGIWICGSKVIIHTRQVPLARIHIT